MADPMEWFQWLPIITQGWFAASLAVNAAATMDVLAPQDLFFDWDRIYNNLELWRIVTSFLYGGGQLNEFHVLILIYLIAIHSSSYEKNPYPTGGTPRADYAFCLLFCVIVTVVSYLVVENYEDWKNIMLSFFGISDGTSNVMRRSRRRNNKMLLYPLFTRNLVTSIMYIWSKRNPNVHIRLNFVPIPGQYLPFAHLALDLALGNRINEVLHGMIVGHLYYYLVDVVPTLTTRRILTTPQILVYLLSGEAQYQQDHRRMATDHRQNAQNLIRRFQAEGATPAHIAAKVGDLAQLEHIASSSPQGRASLSSRDRNGWQPLHEAARGGHLEVVRFLLGFDGVNVNSRTQGGVGPSPLWLTESTHGSNHPVTRYLRAIGAVSIGPGEEERVGGEERDENGADDVAEEEQEEDGSVDNVEVDNE